MQNWKQIFRKIATKEHIFELRNKVYDYCNVNLKPFASEIDKKDFFD